MLELSALKFSANTDELKAAIGTMQQVKAAIGSLEQAQAKAATQSSKASKAASDAAKAEAQAALAAIKLEKEKQKAIEASADATVSAGNRSISVLEKQEQVLNFMVQGYSRGQSSILATAKAAGAATDELAKLGSTLQSQRTLMGSDPFDKSLGALRALKNEFSVVKEQVRLYNAELGLTKKQSEDLARDKLRLIEASKIEGRSLFSVRDSVKELNMEYIRLAKSENDLVAQYKQNVKNTQDSAKANTYLETELQKVRFAVDEQNASLNRGSANAIVRFENALKKSGKTVAEQKVLLDEYRKSLDKLQGAGGARATDYISRAVGPQLTDIIVGLSTGQSLMTVMMQQGGQLRDQFAMMGVAGAEMGMVMRTALSSMVGSVKDTAVAFGQLFVGGVVDAGKAAVNFVSNVTGLNAALDLSKRYFAAMGEEGFKYIGMMQKMGTAMSALAGAALLTVTAGLVALGVALYQVVKENDKLAVSLALTGGSLGLVHTSAIGYIEALGAMGVTTGKATEALVAMGKAGGFAKTDIMLVATAASDMAKYANVAVEDTVKQFAKLREKPVEALIEVAKQTGMVSAETIKMVIELEKAGKSADAGALAMKTYADVSKTQVAQMKENYNGFSLFMIDLGKSISNFFSGAFKTLFLATDPTVAMEKQLKNTQELINKYKGAATYNEDGVTGRQVKALELQARMLSSQIGAQTRLNAEKERELEQNTKDATLLEAKNKLFEKSEDSLDKQLKKTQNLADWQETYISKKKEELAKQSNYNVDQIKFNDKELSQLKELAKVEWDRAHKKDGAKTNKEMDTYLDTLNKIRGISGSYNNDLKDLQSLRQKGLITEQEYVKAVEDLIAVQPFAVAQEKQRSDGLELINKLLGKGEGLGKDYYTSMAKLEALKGLSGFDAKEIEAAQKALQATTPFAKAMSEWFAKATEAVAKSNIETKLQLANIQAQNMELDHNLAMVGLSEEAQKRLTTEFTKQRDLMKANAEYEKIRSDIMKDGSYGTDENKNKALENAASVYQTTLAQINRKAVDDLFVYYTSKAAEAGKNSFGSLSDVLKQAGQLTFATAVNSLGELIDNFDTLTAKQELYNKARNEAQGDTSKLQKLDKAHALLQVKSYGDIAKSMKGFFKEGTTGYKVMGAAEKAFRVYEMAMAVKNNAFKLAAMWGEVKTFVATTAKMIAGVTAEESAKTATRVPGIFAAFMSTMGPWGIPAAIAAMAAVGIAASGSSAPAVVTNQGTGTVFGDSSAKSETISNSLGVLEEVNTLTMRYSAEMLKSLRSIENTLSGVTNIILRSNGMEASAAGIVEGNQMSSFGKLTNSILNAFGLDKLLGGILGKLFGTKTTITGQGIMVQDAKYQDILAGGVEAGYYTDVNRKKKFLGITTSDKNSTNYTADAELSDQFSKLLNGFVDTIKAAAPVLGVSLDTIDANLQDFVLKIGKVDLKDLKGDEIKEKLMSVFGAAGDDIARQTLAGFEKYQQVGEGYLETIVRLASTVESVRGSLDTLNSAFVLSVDNAMELVNAFGDLDKLTTAMSDYNQAYYSESERNATLQRQLTREFTAQNLTLPKNKEEYRKLVEAQDLNTEAGRKMYTLLLTLAPAFASVAAAADEITKELDETTKELESNAITLQIEKLRILGQEEKALNMERDVAIKGLNDYQVALWDANKATQANNESLRSVNSLIPTVLKKFLSEDEWTKYQTNEVANNLVKSNVAFKDITSAVSWLTSATKEQIEVATRELFDMQGLTIDQKKVLLESANIMADLKDASNNVAESIKKAFTKAGDDIVAYIKELTVGRAGLATPAELLDKTRQVYTQDFAAASAGDSDAAGRLVQSAKAYIDAQKTVTASSSFTDDVIKTIISQLSGLGFVSPILQSGSTFIPQYANGGVFTNSVVSQPTTFGIGVMGEAGPEAIMPLSRSSDGTLGVSSDNSSTNKLIARLIVEVQSLKEQQANETAGIISTNIAVTEGTSQAMVDKLNEKQRQAASQPTLN